MAQVPVRKGTVQLGVRIDLDVANALSMQAAYEQTTQRLVIEAALGLYFAHSEVASQVAEEAARRNVEISQIVQEAVQAYLE